MSHEEPPGEYPYQPYGAPYGQQPPPQYGYGYPPPPRHSGPNANAIVSLVINLVTIVSCCNLLAIPGAILAGLSLRTSTDPRHRPHHGDLELGPARAGFPADHRPPSSSSASTAISTTSRAVSRVRD